MSEIEKIDEGIGALNDAKKELQEDFFEKTKKALKENLVEEILNTATKEQLLGMGIDGWIKVAVNFAVDTTVEVMVKPLIKKDDGEGNQG